MKEILLQVCVVIPINEWYDTEGGAMSDVIHNAEHLTITWYNLFISF